jgi:hypothetical protein
MTELAERYRLAEEMVLHRYAVEKDEQGRSQEWKISAIAEDRKTKNDSHILKTFAVEVEATVDALELVKPVVANLCQEACKKEVKEKVVRSLKDWLSSN